MQHLTYQDHAKKDSPLPPVLSEIPYYLRRNPNLRRQKKRKRQGKHSDLLVKLKFHLVRTLRSSLHRVLAVDRGSDCRRFVPWHSLEPAYTFLKPAEESGNPRFRSPCFRREGVILSSLRLVGHEPGRDRGLNNPQSLRLDCTSLIISCIIFFTKAASFPLPFFTSIYLSYLPLYL